MAVLESLSHCQSWVPSWKMSVSPTVLSNAKRCLVGPAYQILVVCEPDNSEISESTAPPLLLPPIFGNCGNPSEAFSTTCPENPCTLACSTETSNCAAVRLGRSGLACAENTPLPRTHATATTAPGTAQRNDLCRAKIAVGLTCLRMRSPYCDLPERC